MSAIAIILGKFTWIFTFTKKAVNSLISGVICGGEMVVSPASAA